MRKLLFLLLIVACSERPHLQVAAAASLQDALQQIGANYEKAGNEHVDFSFGASNILAQQIRAGAPIDIFFSADEPTMDSVAADVLPGSRRDVLSNELAVISLQPLHALSDLVHLKHIALGDPAAVPAGVYAKTYFQRIGLWAGRPPIGGPGANGRGALGGVAGGNAAAAGGARTDAMLAKRARIAFLITGHDAPRIRYPVAIVRQTHDPAAATRFIQYLMSPAAAEVFRKFGFQLVNS